MNNLIQVDLENYINSIKLPERHYLIPLYEIVVNAIQAIHERGNKDGRIDVYVKRDQNKQLSISTTGGERVTEIIGFEVVDNGIGFTIENKEAFSIAFTGHKASYGGKGIGRFAALSAFKKIEVESTFLDIDSNNFNRTKFEFDARNKIHNEKSLDVTRSENKTSVKLIGFMPKYRKKTQPQNIALNLLQHCLIYFITNSQPQIIVHDEAWEVDINLSDFFKEFYQMEDNEDTLHLGEEKFEINYVKNYAKGVENHTIHYCGDNREVKNQNLSKYIPVLDKRIGLIEEAPYYISVYVKGGYLNRNTSSFRDSFNIPQNEEDKDLHNSLTLDEIGKGVSEKTKEQFLSELEIVTSNHRKNYTDYILEDGLEYRHLLEDESILDRLKPTNSDREKDSELHRINYDLECKQRSKVEEFLNPKTIRDDEDYRNLLKEVLEGQGQIGQSKLVNYMIHRRVVLKVLEKFIGLQDDGKFKLEADIHDIIFLRKKTGIQLKFNEHNLWLLDERIAFSRYIASDKELKETDFLEVDSEKKPDLLIMNQHNQNLIYDSKFVYGEEKSSIVIFEFKRPQRTNYTKEEKNLGNQVKGYIKELINGKVKSYNGRKVSITKETPKFGYIIADLNDDLQNELELEGYKLTPKNTFLKFEEGLNLFIEVMNYEQLLKDANERHKAFFSQLGIGLINEQSILA